VKDARFAKTVLLVNGLVPLAMLAWDGVRGRLGANPIEFFIHTTGTLALIFLALSLAVTPIRKIGGWNFLSLFRRMLGLFAFAYALLHLLAWIVFDRAGSLRSVVEETIRRPFITFGMAAFLMMVPLAITSTTAAVKKIGAKRWKMLHRLAYVAAIGGVLHYWYKEKADIRWPLVFALIIGALLLYRMVESLRPRSQTSLAKKAVSEAHR
jgi:sulfoxide reductase heme-binding subunit YedZ